MKEISIGYIFIHRLKQAFQLMHRDIRDRTTIVVTVSDARNREMIYKIANRDSEGIRVIEILHSDLYPMEFKTIPSHDPDQDQVSACVARR